MSEAPRLKTQYREVVRPALQERFEYKNVHLIPKLEKIVVNMGVGEATSDSKAIDAAVNDLRLITGQQPMIARARKSIAAFHLRQDRMWEFFDRLISIAIPRIRDFRGLSTKSFDGNGNYSFGVVEQQIFPEIPFDKIDRVRGMDITFVTTAKTDEEGEALLRSLGFPFKK